MLEWSPFFSEQKEGVIVAIDENQEWLLPWWWENYSKYNRFPVTFVDLGLSIKAREFCREKGNLVELPLNAHARNSDFQSQELEQDSQSFHEDSFRKRRCWHKKPLAMLQTPYLYSLWLDVDCEVRASLLPLFVQIASKEFLLICPEHESLQKRLSSEGTLLKGEIFFNSGVIGFRKGSFYILEWALFTLENQNSYFGDQNILSRLIFNLNWPVEILDPTYNWYGSIYEIPSDVKVVHWAGDMGKFLLSLRLFSEGELSSK